MAIGSMGGRLHPMVVGGGSRSSGLPLGFPTLAASRFTTSSVWAEDFVLASVGTSNASAWKLTQAGSGTGSAGTVTSSNTSTVATLGVLQVATGTTANDSSILEPATRTTGSNTLMPVSGYTSAPAASGFHLMWRVQFGATRTTCKHGFGWIDGGTIAQGTDWITDPDTTLGASASLGGIVITRHTSAYSGDAAGDVIARLYDDNAGAGTDQSHILVAAASVDAGAWKFEFHSEPGSPTITSYVNGVAVGTFTRSNQNWALRPSFGVVTETTSARLANVDAVLLELSTNAAR